jgi:putative transcriptional regulator
MTSLPRLGPLLALLLGLLCPAAACAADISDSVILVAKRELRDGVYGASILLARPVDADRHVGLIINKPTQTTLANLFPDHAPSRKVADPVFLGGPVGSGVIFALVKRKESPGTRSLRIGPDLFLATDSRVVDQIIEAEPAQARFFSGVVVWNSGELAEEVRRGLWFVQEPRAEIVLRKPAGLWEELVNRLELQARTF